MSNMIQFGRRFAAFVFDRILIIMLMRPDILAVALFGEISEWWRMVLEFSSLGLVSVYVVGSHWRWGRTLGKRAFGLRVATIDGVSPPPFSYALIRYLPFLIIGLIPLLSWLTTAFDWIFGEVQLRGQQFEVLSLLLGGWMILEVVVSLATNGFRSVHDIIAKTVVTNESSKKKT